MDVNDNSSIHCSSYTRQWVASVRSRMASRLGMTLSPPPVIVPSPPQLPRGWTRQRPKTPPPPPNPEYDYANIDKELRALVDLEYVRWEEDKKRREKFPNGEKGGCIHKLGMKIELRKNCTCKIMFLQKICYSTKTKFSLF